MTKQQAAQRVIKLRNVAASTGTKPERETAARLATELVKKYGLTLEDLQIREGLDSEWTAPDRARDTWGRFRTRRHEPPAPRSGDLVVEDGDGWVHLAASYMLAICGKGPTFVWMKTRAELANTPHPCPNCMRTGVIDARRPSKRLEGYPPL